MATKMIKINGNVVTDFFTPTGMTVSYETVEGTNAGVSISGTTIADEIAYKAVVTLTCVPLTEGQQSSLLSSLYSSQYATLYYFDPKAGGYRTIECVRTTTQQKHRGVGGNSSEYWTGLVVTLRER